MDAKPAYKGEIPRVRVRSLNSSIILGMTTEDDVDVPPFRVCRVVVKLICRVRMSSNGAVVANVAKSRAVDPNTYAG